MDYTRSKNIISEAKQFSLNGDVSIKEYYRIYRQRTSASKKKYNDDLIINSENKSNTAWRVINYIPKK